MNAERRTQNEELRKVSGFLHSTFCILRSAFTLLILFAASASAQVIDNFDGPLSWQAHPSDGVALTIAHDARGYRGSSMRLDFDFQGHAGYAIARKMVSIDLPADYEFSFWIRGRRPPNNLEFKLIDSSGDNVWWVNQPNFEFPSKWTRLVLKKRHIQFAWGPAGGGEPHHIAAIEIVVTAGHGGKGSVWVDELRLSERHVAAVDQPPTFTSSPIEFPEMREFGGLIIDTEARDYDVQIEDAAGNWDTAYSVRRANGRRQYLYMPETEARAIRVAPPSIQKIIVEPVRWSATRNEFFTNVAGESTRGDFPRYLYREQSYWTVVGIDGDTSEALINEDGTVEPEKGGYSIEPFLYVGGRLITWNDAQARQSLPRGYLPLPTVTWRTDDMTLDITAYAAGKREASTFYVDYTLRSSKKIDATLFLAIRPFQVNPPWQFLGVTGGVSPIREIRYESHTVQVDDRLPIIPLTSATGFGAASFDEGNIVDWLRRGKLPDRTSVTDDRGHAAGALKFVLRLQPRIARTVTIAVPFHQQSPASDGMRASVVRDWQDRLTGAAIELPSPAQHIVDSIRSSVAYILIHRDGPALQPGSRSYERSWIRDGAMISDALLRLGLNDVVRDYINWYVQFQYADGKVPCCVDSRGADPVPENDSHGELIYLIAEYFRHTGDRALVESVWPHVVGAVNYIDTLRKQRMSAQYLNTPFYGMLPESISHEGYSAKAMHSYWDDFWAAKGLSDAAALATAIGHAAEAKRFAAISDEFERDLLASIRGAMAMKKIDYIPGSVELGDYDPTSTTIAIAPGSQLSRLPRSVVDRTFDRYFEESRARAMGSKEWVDYTPYELRTVGTFVRLGQPERAHEMLDFFFRGQRPAAWNEWAEVVFRDPRTPKFIGDMPHGWVASDYLRSVLEMFAYDRDDGALVIGAGLRPEWVTQETGVSVSGLSTHQGKLAFTMRRSGREVRVVISAPQRLTNGIVVHSPRPGVRSVRVNGHSVRAAQDVTVREVPGEVVFRY
jgi:hypothetical protein